MPFEFDILYWFQSLHNPILDKIAWGFTMLGENGLVCILTGLLLLFMLKDKKMGLTTCIALVVSFAFCNLLLKNLFQRDRPCWIDPSVELLVKTPKDYSFPSGHTSIAVATAVSIVQFNKKWGIIAILLAIMVGLSRMYLFVHFPTDVLVGAIVGGCSAILSGVIIKRWYQLNPDYKVPFIEK